MPPARGISALRDTQSSNSDAVTALCSTGWRRGTTRCDVGKKRFAERATPPEKRRFTVADLSRGLPFRDGCADAVFANQVIEHLLDSEHFVKEVARVPRRQGAALITPRMCHIFAPTGKACP